MLEKDDSVNLENAENDLLHDAFMLVNEQDATYLQAIAKDSVLSRCKIIAEPWDCGGLYLVGKFPNWDR